jgi:hypothetical protein
LRAASASIASLHVAVWPVHKWMGI